MGPTAEGRVAEGGEAKRDPAAARDAVHDEWDGTGRGSEIGEASAANGVVRTPRFCAECGYALIGLPRDGVCPECRWPVERSLGEPWLGQAPVGHLERVRIGVLCVGIAVKIAVVGWAVVYWGWIITELSPGMEVFRPLGWMMWGMVDVLTTSVAAAGYWGMTAVEPDPRIARRGELARAWIRRPTLGIFACMLVRVVLVVLGAGHDVGSEPGRVVYWGSWMVALMLSVPRAFGVLEYTRWLGERATDKQLMETAARNRWRLPVVCLSTTMVCCALGLPGILLMPVGPMAAVTLYGMMLGRLRRLVKQVELRAATHD